MDLTIFLQQQIDIYGDELTMERQLLPQLPLRMVAADGQTDPGDRGAQPAAMARPEKNAAAVGAGTGPTTAAGAAAEQEPAVRPDIDVGTLEALNQRISGCRLCPISSQRHQLVFGEGDPQADIMLIGEAPGFHEDQQGRPFVGEAGQLLTKILAAIKLERHQVYICNLIKCRPTNNRDPLPAEIDNCRPYLEKQLELIRPAFILCLGRFSAQTLLQSQAPLSQLRGVAHQWRNSRLIVTYHPAALLRYPKFKTETWQDVQLLRRLYDEYLNQKTAE